MRIRNLSTILILMFLSLFIFPAVYAAEGHIPLLAVRETDSGYEGSTADLYLEIKNGRGRVFLDTFPLTKLDTQMSTRFAEEIACDYLDINCENYDFIYTIESNSAIVGGPSAGAAETLLTISALSGIEIDKDTAITGTINSGGLIGPVGGLKEKIDAGASLGLKRILIPDGMRFMEQSDTLDFGNMTMGLKVNINNTLDLVEYGKEKGVEVTEVADLDEALYELTGTKRQQADNVTIDPDYTRVMQSLALDLCNRTTEFKDVLSDLEIPDELTSDLESARNLTAQARVSFKEEKYYAAASYCFGANVKYNYVLLSVKNFSQEEIEQKVDLVTASISYLEDDLKARQISTITDLESYMVVVERLTEAKDYINKPNATIYDISYGIERLYSAYSWHDFFGKAGKTFNLNKDVVRTSCREKLSEAEERNQYVGLFLPSLKNSRKELDYAYSDLEAGNYELCLFRASKAKAEANDILNLLGVSEDQLDLLINTKLEIIKKNIAKQINDGIFPILGYSYYEYADSLKSSDKLSSLLYLEYALELSNLNLYFEDNRGFFRVDLDIKAIIIFVIGLLSGFIIAFTIRNKRKK